MASKTINPTRMELTRLKGRLRTAVRRRPLSRVSSIRVGLIVLLAMRTPPYACFLGRYFSMNSGLMRLSSVSGRMDSSSQPMFSVSSMERFSS